MHAAHTAQLSLESQTAQSPVRTVQSQKAVTAHLKSEQLLPFCFAGQNTGPSRTAGSVLGQRLGCCFAQYPLELG